MSTSVSLGAIAMAGAAGEGGSGGGGGGVRRREKYPFLKQVFLLPEAIYSMNEKHQSANPQCNGAIVRPRVNFTYNSRVGKDRPTTKWLNSWL